MKLITPILFTMLFIAFFVAMPHYQGYGYVDFVMMIMCFIVLIFLGLRYAFG